MLRQRLSFLFAPAYFNSFRHSPFAIRLFVSFVVVIFHFFVIASRRVSSHRVASRHTPKTKNRSHHSEHAQYPRSVATRRFLVTYLSTQYLPRQQAVGTQVPYRTYSRTYNMYIGLPTPTITRIITRVYRLSYVQVGLYLRTSIDVMGIGRQQVPVIGIAPFALGLRGLSSLLADDAAPLVISSDQNIR